MATDRPSTSDPPTREARLAAALRENLKRRKAQARGRAATERPESAPMSDTPSAPTDTRQD